MKPLAISYDRPYRVWVCTYNTKRHFWKLEMETSDYAMAYAHATKRMSDGAIGVFVLRTDSEGLDKIPVFPEIAIMVEDSG